MSIRAKAPLEIVQSNLCGLMQTPSLASSYCVLRFIDDYTRKIWVYFLKQKSEVFEQFYLFKALVEKQSRHNIKVLITDMGREYISKHFLHFYREHGIHKNFTTRYTYKKNGVVLGRSCQFCSLYLNRYATKAIMIRVPE